MQRNLKSTTIPMNSEFLFIDTSVSFFLSIVSPPVSSFLFQMIGEILKKVIVQYSRNARKQFGIDILLAEYLIYIGTAARQLAGKPGDTSLLVLQSLSNKFPYRFHGLQDSSYRPHKKV